MVSCKFSLKPIHWKSCCPWWPDRWSEHSAAAPTPIAQQCQRKSLCATPPGPSYASYRRGARPTAHLFSPRFFRGRAMDGQPVIYSGSRNMEAMLREHGWDFWVFLENIWKYDWVISDNYHENYPNIMFIIGLYCDFNWELIDITQLIIMLYRGWFRSPGFRGWPGFLRCSASPWSKLSKKHNLGAEGYINWLKGNLTGKCSIAMLNRG